MESLTRWLFPPKPAISKEEAIAIAQAECARHGWGWMLPIRTQLKRDRWVIYSPDDRIWMPKTRIEVDCENGRVLERIRVPR